MTSLSCADVLAGRAPDGTPVTIKGWVRTRRDSKAGISFVQRQRRLRPSTRCRSSRRTRCRTTPTRSCSLTAGCAVEATGKIVASPAKGQPFELQADRDRGGRLGRRPGHLPDPAEAAHVRVPARGRASAAAHQHDRRGDAGAPHASRRRSTASSTSTASSGSTRRSSRRPTPRAPARCSGSRRSTSRTCRARPTARSTSRRTSSGARRYLTVSGQLNVETYCLALSQGLHVRPDVPRRELEHEPPPRRVLDDRAGDRLRRPRRRRGTSPRSSSSTSSRRCSTSARTTWRSSTSASRRA